MAVPLAPRTGVIVMLSIAAVMGANHVAARLAFEHGASVAAAVAVRSGSTALAVLALLGLKGVSLALDAATRRRAIFVGALVALQSFCLYSAVARIPVALALLAFNTFPLLFVLLSWASGGERPPRHVALVIAMALGGLSLALDVVGKAEAVAGQWARIGTGVLFAFAASASFAVVLLLTNRWLKPVDGRLRTFMTMATTAVLVSLVGGAGGALALPADATGWAGLAVLTLLYGSGITVLFAVLPRLSSPSLTVALNFEPIAALALAWAILGQTIAASQLAGAFLVVAAIVLLGLPRRAAAGKAG